MSNPASAKQNRTDATSLSGATALVTGATGFIGAHLVRRLVEAGARVHAVSRRPRPSASATVAWHAADLADAGAVESLFATVRPDLVFHLASEVSGSRAVDLVLPTFQSNLASTVNLLVAATRTPCRRFVVTGSLEEPESISEAPCSPYAAAKVAARLYASMFHALYGVPVVHARLFMVYGPAQKDENKIVPYVIRALLAGRPLQLSAGTRPVDWVHVDDVVGGLLAIAVAPGAIDGQRLDLGSGELVTVRAVVEKLAAQIHPGVGLPFGTLAERPFEQVRVADIATTAAAIAWKPTVPLDEGLRRTIEWCRANRTQGEPG